MIDRIDKTIQDAEQTERTAFYAKQKAYEKLKKNLERKYSDKLNDLDRIQNWKFKVRGSYESTALTLSLIVELDEETGDNIDFIHDEIDELDPYYAYKDRLRETIREIVFKDLDIETSININLKYGNHFESFNEDDEQ